MPPRKKPVSRKKTTPKPLPHYLPYRYITPRPQTPLHPGTPLPPSKKTVLERSENIARKIKPYLAVAAVLLSAYAAGKQIYGIGKNTVWLGKKIKGYKPTDYTNALVRNKPQELKYIYSNVRRQLDRGNIPNKHKQEAFSILNMIDHRLASKNSKKNNNNNLSKRIERLKHSNTNNPFELPNVPKSTINHKK